ncbi:MAG: family 10 glycosylhydrolase [Verrucomicrobiota bacterium]
MFGFPLRRLAPLLLWPLLALSAQAQSEEGIYQPESETTGATALKEFRGVWVTTVWNINFPQKAGQSASAQKAQLRKIVATVKEAGLNAILFQVRPESDAAYESELEPWSHWLSGRQGKSPGYDPLEYLIDLANEQGIEVHAWINPYRAASSSRRQPSSSRHPAKRFPQHAHTVRGQMIMDPSAEVVQNHIVAVVEDILERYDVAGIHFDDYFYPYPKAGKSPNLSFDDKPYSAYRDDGGTLSKEDWRRQNVASLLQKVYRAVKDYDPDLLFGVSPFGIAKPGIPEGTTAQLDYYNHCFADPLEWLAGGYLDYLAPQLYWPDKGEQSFRLLLEWWRSPEANPKGIPIYPGIAVDRMKSHKWSVKEIELQMELTESIAPEVGGGYILWNYRSLSIDEKGVMAVLQKAARD